MAVEPGYRQTFDPVPGHASRFTGLLRSLSPDELEARVPGMTWTADDVGRHVLTVLHRYGGNRTRAATRHELTDQNQQELELVGASAAEVADGIDGAIAILSELAPHLPLDQPVEFHLGITIELSAAWANLCSEFLVHGTDIARATGREWSFPAADVEGIWRNLFPAISGWLRLEALAVDELYEIRFPFGPVAVWVRNGSVTVDDATRAADHVVEVDDPVAFTLAVPWRRSLVTDPAAALLLSRFHEI